LGPGGLTELHGASPGTLVYTDPSGIKISYSGQPHSQYVNAGGSRGWNNDQFDPVGSSEITGAGFDHLAMAHFSSADTVTGVFKTHGQFPADFQEILS